MIPGFRPTELLTEAHDVAGFQCGKSALDDWLRRHALANQRVESSRTFVVCPVDDPAKVAGYYALSYGAVMLEDAPDEVRRGMPPKYSIPIITLARLAVDQAFRPPARKVHLGSALLKDSLIRSVRAANEAGLKAMVLDALDEDAKGFYERFGFIPSPTQDLQYFLPMNRIRASLLAAGHSMNL